MRLCRFLFILCITKYNFKFYYLLENLSGYACKILTTYLFKNSVPTVVLIHSHASISGATITPARFVNVFPLPAGLNSSPSFNCVKWWTNQAMHGIVIVCKLLTNPVRASFQFQFYWRAKNNHLRLSPSFWDLDTLRRFWDRLLRFLERAKPPFWVPHTTKLCKNKIYFST